MKKSKKKKFNKLNILNIFSLIFITLFLILLIKLNMIPKNYLLVLTSVLTLLEVVSIVLTNLKNKICKVIGIILDILLLILSIFGSYFIYNGNLFLDKSFNNIKNEQYITYYVVSYSSNTAGNRNEIDDTVYYVNNDSNITSAINTLKKYVKNEITETKDISDLFTLISNKQAKYALISNTSYEILFDNSENLKRENYKIVYQYKIKIKNKNSNKVSNNTEKFNVYISGTDFANLSDFNMIMTVNNKTHKVLLTSIPRDYYLSRYCCFI